MTLKRVARVGTDPLRLEHSAALQALGIEVICVERDMGNLAQIRGADLVVEALSEQPHHLPVKEAVLREVDSLAAPHAIIATQRGPWRVTDLVEHTQHPQRIMAFHCPAVAGDIVEIAGHPQSDPMLLEKVWSFLGALGRTPLASADAPGGVVDRLAVPWFNEAVRLVQEGLPLGAVEQAACGAFGAGPFATMNLWGVPRVSAAATALGHALGAFYEPVSDLAAQAATDKPWHIGATASECDISKVSDRLWGVVLHVALDMISEHVSSPRDIDVGACQALGWTRGPFVVIDKRGPLETARVARIARTRYGLWAPAALQTMVHQC